MKLSKLYSNRPEIFGPIKFVPGLNVVVAEIRLPENKKKDTHNLGKTTLGRLIDFCLLSSRDNRFFLFKHLNLFKDFVFFIEIALLDGSFVTVRRGVQDASKISFKKHTAPNQDFATLSESEWDHDNVAFDRARELLDGLLDLRALAPWSFRKCIGYHLRSQDDYTDVFQLKKFAGAHSDWKPFLAHILGFQADLVADHYTKEDSLTDKQEKVATLEQELGGSLQDISKIEGMLLLKQKDAEKRQKLLDAFDFRGRDKDKTKELVEGINAEIAALNENRYTLMQNRSKILSSLEEAQILFDPKDAKMLFRETGVLFKGQIKRDFEQLIAFNRAITEERHAYLKKEREEIEDELSRINTELSVLGKRRSDALAFLSSTDPFKKYKEVTEDLVTLKADIISLERQRTFLNRLLELRKEIRALSETVARLQSQIEDDVEKQNSDSKSLFSSIRFFFDEIIEDVIDRKALLSVAPNTVGHLEFKAEILDESGNTTSADFGHTYKRLLCVAFDMALVRGHLTDRFPRFIFHDGVFEGLDDRKKENLLAVIREYSQLGAQHIITLIDSDLPRKKKTVSEFFESEDIVLWLHDEGQQGRLFRMPSW